MGMLLLNGSSDLNPRELFASGEQGLWLDPSDMTATKAAWRRNLLQRSEQFDNSYWTKQQSTCVANSANSPFGDQTADLVYPSGDTSFQGLSLSVGATWQRLPHRFSIYAKASGKNWLYFYNVNFVGGNTGVWFNLQAGTVGTVGAAWSNATIESLGNGWYRCSATATPGGTNDYFYLLAGDNNNSANCTPNATDGLLLYGAQLELGSTPTEYQPITDFSTEFKAAFPTHTLYQDSNGVTPCTAAGDPVGLILDQSRGGLGALGPELITSGDGTSLTGWVAGALACTSAISGGEFRITHSGTNFGSICFPFTTVVGRFYRFSATYVGGTGDGRVIKADSTNFTNNRVDVVGSQTVMTPGTSTIFFQATATTTYVHLLADNSAGEVSIYDNISVREVPGNHAYQTTSASRPTLARIPSSGRRNVLVRSEEFDSISWTKDSGAAVTANTSTSPVSDSSADTLTANSGGNYRQLRQTIGLTSGDQRTFSCYAKAGTTSVIYLQLTDNTANSDGRYFDLSNGTLGGQTGMTVGTTAVLNNSTIESIGNGWYRCRITVTANATTSWGFAIGIVDANNSASVTANKTVLIWGAQLETGSTATNLQRVGSTHDVTESGVSDLWHLVFDGSDDSLVTNAVDFSATDEMTVIGGLRKLSDAASGMVAELSATASSNNGSFNFLSPRANGEASFAFTLNGGGAINLRSYTGLAAPRTDVISATLDTTAADSTAAIAVRLNGASTTGTEVVTAASTGNFGNHVLNIGRRNQATIPFNGHIYQLIIRGKTTPTGKLLEAERFVARKTGVTGI